MAPSHSPSGRARGHGEFLRSWESAAPLTDGQLRLCATVEAQCAPLPHAKLPDSAAVPRAGGGEEEGAAGSARGGAHPYKGVDGLRGLATVATAEDFHVWHDEMERRLEEANEHKYRTLVVSLQRDRDTVEGLLRVADAADEALRRVKEGRRLVDEVVVRFKSDCENMVSDRKKMGELADALRKRLTYFEELETLTTKFGGGKDAIDPTHPDFVRLLHRLDECVAYASSSTGAVAEADGYLARFLELQRRAFTSVRDHTVTVLRDTANTVAKELKSDRASGAGFRHADLTDASKEYLRFRTIAPKVKSLMTELHSRAKMNPAGKGPLTGRDGSADARGMYGRGVNSISDPYSNPAASGISGLNTNPAFSTRSTALYLYSDCEECFFEQRKNLLEPSVAAHVKSLGDVRNMIALARLGSAHVLRVCQLERQLYEHFFPSEASEADESAMLLSALRGVCDMVYIELRPQIVQEDDLDKLVYLIEVLKTEILGDEVPRRGFAGKAFAPSAVRAIADAQERIIFRAEVFMRDGIRGFVPKPEHLDYPERILQHQRQIAAASRGTQGAGQPSSMGASSHGAGAEGSEPSKRNLPKNEVPSIGIHATWYPPVERTLRLLSMLYRCVDGEVFAGVAQEAVAICVQSVGSAAARIAAMDKPNAEDHAQLFLVWQLLMTREQISPFDVEMSYTEHELDFFELRSLLGSVIRGQLSARSLTAPPAMRAKVVDSKRELDHRVRGACESFILKTTRLLLDPVLSFLAKCNALPVPRRGAHTELGPGEVPATPPKAPFDMLKANSGSFAHPKRLRETWQKVNEAVSNELPALVDRMKIYISKAASRAVLLRPIRANIAEAATELLSSLQLRYTLDEREVIGIDGEQVGKLLDEVDSIMGIGVRTPMGVNRS